MRLTTGLGTAGSIRTIARSRSAIRAAILVPRPVMLSSFWVASTKRCKDAGRAHSQLYGRDRGRGSAPRDRGPEAEGHRRSGHCGPPGLGLLALAHEPLAGGAHERHRLG